LDGVVEMFFESYPSEVRTEKGLCEISEWEEENADLLHEKTTGEY